MTGKEAKYLRKWSEWSNLLITLPFAYNPWQHLSYKNKKTRSVKCCLVDKAYVHYYYDLKIAK